MFATSHLNYIDTLPTQKKYNVPTPPTLQRLPPVQPHQEELLVAEETGHQQQVTPNNR